MIIIYLKDLTLLMLIIIEWTIGPMIRVRISCYWEVSYFTYDLRPCQKVIFEEVSRNAAHHLSTSLKTHYFKLFPDSASSDSDSDRVTEWHHGFECAEIFYTDGDLSSAVLEMKGGDKEKCCSLTSRHIAQSNPLEKK